MALCIEFYGESVLESLVLGNILCYHLLHGKTRGISVCIKFGGASSSITMSNKKWPD